MPEVRIKTKKRSRLLEGRPTWYTGTVNGNYFEACVYIEPSRYGINGGMVSKLWMCSGPQRSPDSEIAVYDREWECTPGEATQLLVDAVVAAVEADMRTGQDTAGM